MIKKTLTLTAFIGTIFITSCKRDCNCKLNTYHGQPLGGGEVLVKSEPWDKCKEKDLGTSTENVGGPPVTITVTKRVECP